MVQFYGLCIWVHEEDTGRAQQGHRGKLTIQDTREYSLTLRDIQHVKTGVDCIAEVKSAPKDKHLSSMFPDTKAVTAREFSRPYISVHVVLGM